MYLWRSQSSLHQQFIAETWRNQAEATIDWSQAQVDWGKVLQWSPSRIQPAILTGVTENPQSLDEELFEKLKDIKSQIDSVKGLSYDLKNLGEK